VGGGVVGGEAHIEFEQINPPPPPPAVIDTR